jgi:hypothetical protein
VLDAGDVLGVTATPFAAELAGKAFRWRKTGLLASFALFAPPRQPAFASNIPVQSGQRRAIYPLAMPVQAN